MEFTSCNWSIPKGVIIINISFSNNRRSSGEQSKEGSKPPSPPRPRTRKKSAKSSGEQSKEGSLPPSPPRSQRVMFQTAADGAKFDHTMPRRLNSTVGMKIVELHKGPIGLGIQLMGGTDTPYPVTVKMVIPGGPAHKNGNLRAGDVIVEANWISFEKLTHEEAIRTMKGLPQGKVNLMVRDRTATLPARPIFSHWTLTDRTFIVCMWIRQFQAFSVHVHYTYGLLPNDDILFARQLLYSCVGECTEINLFTQWSEVRGNNYCMWYQLHRAKLSTGIND